MNLFNIEIKKVFRSKRKIINVIIFGIFITLIIAVKSINATTNNYLKNDIYHGYNQRSMVVYYDNENNNYNYNDLTKIENDVMSVEHVESAYSYFYANNGAKIVEYDGNLPGEIYTFASNNNSVLPIVKGTNYPDDSGNYMICPEKFYPYINYVKMNKLSSKDKYNLEDKIGQEFTLQYKNFKSNETMSIKVKLVGLYRNQPNHTDENVCFVTKKVNEEISLGQYTNDTSWSIDQYNSLAVVIDDARNIDKVAKDLKKLGYVCELGYSIAYDYFEKIFNFIDKIYNILLILFGIFLFIFCYKEYNDNYKEYKLLEVLGYNRNQLLKNVAAHAFIELLSSFIISLVLVLLSRIAINVLLYYKPFIFNKWTIIIDFNSYIFIYLFLFMVYFIIYLFNRLMRLIKND